MLIAARDDRGISQAQASRELNVARSAYRLWELGVARPAPARWSELAEWLGVSVTTLIDADGLVPNRGRDGDDRPDDPLELARTLIETAVERGIVTAAEALRLMDVLERVRDESEGLGESVDGA